MTDYSKIINPETGRKVSVTGLIGKKILSKYISYLNGGDHNIELGNITENWYFKQVENIKTEELTWKKIKKKKQEYSQYFYNKISLGGKYQHYPEGILQPTHYPVTTSKLKKPKSGSRTIKFFADSMFDLIHKKCKARRNTRGGPYLTYTEDVIDILTTIITDKILPSRFWKENNECRWGSGDEQYCCLLGNKPNWEYGCKANVSGEQENKLAEAVDVIIKEVYLILQVCRSQNLQYRFYTLSTVTLRLSKFLTALIWFYGGNTSTSVPEKFNIIIENINYILKDEDKDLNNLIIWSCLNTSSPNGCGRGGVTVGKCTGVGDERKFNIFIGERNYPNDDSIFNIKDGGYVCN